MGLRFFVIYDFIVNQNMIFGNDWHVIVASLRCLTGAKVVSVGISLIIGTALIILC